MAPADVVSIVVGVAALAAYAAREPSRPAPRPCCHGCGRHAADSSNECGACRDAALERIAAGQRWRVAREKLAAIVARGAR